MKAFQLVQNEEIKMSNNDPDHDRDTTALNIIHRESFAANKR